jgi:uncharacterized membrane protein
VTAATAPDTATELRLIRKELAAIRRQVIREQEAREQVTREQEQPAVPPLMMSVPPVHVLNPAPAPGRSTSGTHDGGSLWRHHPHVRSGDQLSFGERAADVMRSAFGSWTFVIGFLAFMAVWIVVNTAVLGSRGWDRYPYILLNLALSMMAGLQGALILIAAKRADRVSAEQATAHYAETSKLDSLQTQNNEMTGRIETATRLIAEIHQHVTAQTS